MPLLLYLCSCLYWTIIRSLLPELRRTQEGTPIGMFHRICIYMCVCVYIYIQRERETQRERESDKEIRKMYFCFYILTENSGP